MPYRRHSNRQGSGVASEYSKAGIDTFWKIPFKNNYIYVRPEYCVWQNEAGKSTIHAFVRSMLFGIPDTEEGNERYSHYLPWETPHDFCGRMWIKKDDKVYRIERNFLRPQPTVRVFDDETGESLQPAKQHLRQILSVSLRQVILILSVLSS